MNKKFLNITFLVLLFAFSSYIYFVFSSNDKNSIIVSTFTSICVLVFLYANYKSSQDTDRKKAFLVFTYYLLWLLLEINTLIKLYNINVLPNSLINFIYILSFLCIVIYCLLFVVDSFSFFDKIQLFIDLITVLVCLYYFFKIVLDIVYLKHNTNLDFSSTSFLVIVMEFILILLLILMVFVFRIASSYIDTGLTIFSFIVVCFVDFLSIYPKNYVLNSTWINLLHILPLLLVFISVVVEQKDMNYIKNSNSNVNIIVSLLISIVILDYFYIAKGSFYSENIYILFLCIAYLAISLNYQGYIKNKTMIKSQKIISDTLENSIFERNIQLEKTNEQLQKTLNSDVLTGIGSRKYLMEVLEYIDVSYNNTDVAIFVIDIVQFKKINEMTNHRVGDYVLKEVASRLENMFSNKKVFRSDSNEFVVLLDNTSFDENELEMKAKNIVSVLTGLILYDTYKININIAIGCDRYSNKITKFSEIFQNASYACKEVKEDFDPNKNYLLYNEDMEKLKMRKSNISNLLVSIDYDKEFTMYYQPQYSTDGKTLIGMESLLRWNSPKLGFVSPGEFIPIAENSNTIVKIVRWTIGQSVRQIKLWNEKYNSDLKMAVNISPKYLDNDDFLREIEYYISNGEIKPKWLDLEITEMSVMKVGETIEKLLEDLHKKGLFISMDDFGTGYSSLSYIKNFKINKLKIAKELIDHITTDKNEYMIVRAIIMMAKGLGLNTIAEGVEQKEQRDILLKLKCDQIQGFFYGRPVPASEFEDKFIKKHFNTII